MEKTGVQRLAGALKILVTITFCCNLVALLLVPGLAMMKGFAPLLALRPYEAPLEIPLRVLVFFAQSWAWVWSAGSYDVVLTLFLLFCGLCTAVILWQGRRLLDTVLAAQNPGLNPELIRAAFCQAYPQFAPDFVSFHRRAALDKDLEPFC